MQENFNRVVGLIIDEEVNEMLPPDEHPPLVYNKGHEVMLPEQGQQLVGQGHFVPLSGYPWPYLTFVMWFLVCFCFGLNSSKNARTHDGKSGATSFCSDVGKTFSQGNSVGTQNLVA